MTALIILIIFNFILTITLFLFLFRRTTLQNRAGKLLKEVRGQMNDILTELDRVADRNVSILEERIRKVEKVIGEADKRLRLLDESMQNQRRSDKHYTALKKNRPVVMKSGSKPSAVPVKKVAVQQQDLFSGVPEGRGNSGNIQPVNITSGDAEVSLSRSDENPSAVPANSSTESSAESRSRKSRVLALFNNGDAPSLIASKLSVTTAEVELILSIHDRKGFR